MSYPQFFLPQQQQQPQHPHPQMQQHPQLQQHPHPQMPHQLQFPPPVPPQHREPQHPLNIDPALSLYSPDFYYQPHPPQIPQHMHSIPPQTLASTSSPSSEESDSPLPPIEPAPSVISNGNPNGKRVAPAPSATGSRKKQRKSDKMPPPDVDADELGTLNGDDKEGKVKPTRGSRACTVCRRLKMKCVGAEQGPPCKRCVAGNYECIFEESNRGKRSSKKHEQFQRTLRKMERTIATVLQSITHPGVLSIPSGMVSRSPSPSAQTATTNALLASPSPPPSAASAHNPALHSPKLHSLPDNTLNPLGLLAEASLANRRAQQLAGTLPADGPDGAPAIKVGVANDTYFKPGPMTILPLRRLYIERQVQPEMLSFVSTEEVIELFKIFFDSMNLHATLLDREFHTPSLVCSRSPFLLTTICAIASKFYPKRPELHARLNTLARKLAFSVPERGYKSVEIVQAYLLLALWGCGPTERYEQDKTWLLLGMGIRMATDLNLHRKTSVPRASTPEGQARDKEVHNRERTWLMCFILDRSMSSQMGKPHTIREDFIVRNVGQWWKSPAAIPTDAGLAGYVELQRILSRSLDFLYSGTHSASGLQTDCDYLLVIKTIEAQLLAWQAEWTTHITGALAGGAADTSVAYLRLISRFYFHYAMLIVNSFGLQNAIERAQVDMGHFFARCHSAAMACATIVRDELGPQGFLRYSPDAHFVQCSYAVLSLLKMVRPEFQAFLENEAKTLELVRDIADLLEAIAAGPLHTPALYSTFLRALISAKTDGAPADDGGFAPQAHAPAADFQFVSEMGPTPDADPHEFAPPTPSGAAPPDEHAAMMSMDSILTNGFWDSMLVPGYSNTLEGMSGGFVYGANGSGLITPRIGSPGPFGSAPASPMTGLRAEPFEAAPATLAEPVA